jgi:hypothetical protein
MIKTIKLYVDEMDVEKMGRMIRFAPTNIMFTLPELSDYFMARFNKLGGWTPQLSKLIGWEKNE